jgi:hypothetical protein
MMNWTVLDSIRDVHVKWVLYYIDAYQDQVQEPTFSAPTNTKLIAIFSADSEMEHEGERTYEGVSKIFRTGHLERELQMVQLSATRCSCIAILWVRIMSFAAITLCVASQRIILKVSYTLLSIQSGNFWIHPVVFDLTV